MLNGTWFAVSVLTSSVRELPALMYGVLKRCGAPPRRW